MWKRKKKNLNEPSLSIGAFEYQADVHVEKKYEDMSWEEIQEGLELVRLVAEFDQRYGEIPELKKFGPFILGWRKVMRWKHEFDIFREGVKSGSKWAMEWIENSGWLKDGVREELERGEKEKKGDNELEIRF